MDETNPEDSLTNLIAFDCARLQRLFENGYPDEHPGVKFIRARLSDHMRIWGSYILPDYTRLDKDTAAD